MTGYFVLPETVSQSRVYALVAIGVILGVLIAWFGASIAPNRFPYFGLGIAVLSLASAMFVVWLLRLWLVGRVGRNLEGRISRRASQLGSIFVIGTLGMMLAAVLLFAFLVAGILFDWNLSWWGQALVSVIAVHMILRTIIGLVLNISLIMQLRSRGTAASDI